MQGVDGISSFLLTILGSLSLLIGVSVVFYEDLNLMLHLKEVLVELWNSHA